MSAVSPQERAAAIHAALPTRADRDAFIISQGGTPFVPPAPVLTPKVSQPVFVPVSVPKAVEVKLMPEPTKPVVAPVVPFVPPVLSPKAADVKPVVPPLSVTPPEIKIDVGKVAPDVKISTGIGDVPKITLPTVGGVTEKKKAMGWLADFAADIAPKIIKATTIGGSKADRDVLKNNVDAAVFQPVYKKFGKDFETGAKIAGAIATVTAAGVGLPLKFASGSGPLSSSMMPGASGPTASAGGAATSPSWVVPVAIGVGLLLFGKTLLKWIGGKF